jgi:hypothetical protein
VRRPAAALPLIPLALVILAAACGSTSVTNVTSPGAVRCTASIGTSSNTVPAQGGTISVSVTAARDCTWSADSEAAWLKLTSTSGQGAATITVTASSNDAAAARTGSITVNDQRLDLTQDGRGCAISLGGPAGTVPASGSHGSLTISTLAGCPWTLSSSAAWVVPATTSGTGASTVAYDVQANTDVAREATLSAGTARFVVSQAAAPAAPACTYALDASQRDFPASCGSGAVAVTTQAGCSWSVSGGASWITVPGSGGSGSGTLAYSVAANTTPASRQATLTIAGRVYTVTQQGIACTVTITPPSQTFTAAGGSGTIQITTPAGCTWTAASNAGWTLLAASSGVGAGQLSYQVQSNTDTASRTAAITIGGQTHSVTQQGASCSVSITPPSQSFTAAGGSGSVQVTAPLACSWTATSDAAWVVPTPAGGAGSRQLTYQVAANADAASRTATLTIGGQTHSITQSGAAPVCSYDLTPAARNVTAAGGAFSVHVAAATGCAWTAVSSATWIVVGTGAGAGSGDADIAYTVTANPDPAPRSGTITVAGKTHTITQDAAAPVCTYALTPGERTFAPAGGSGSVTVTTGPTCGWTAISDSLWVTVLTPVGIGTGTINYVVLPGAVNVDRTATITVNGQVHTVRQRSTN